MASEKDIQEATHFYQTAMNAFSLDTSRPRTPWELREKHAELKFQAIDYFRLHTEREANAWRLERDIDNLYKALLAVDGKRKRDLVTRVDCLPARRVSESNYVM